jgi:hypothetical protein
MSGHGFHVHGPHDHAVEHASHAGDSLASRVAVMTAVLSTIGAIFSYQGGFTQNEALVYKNQSILYKNQSVLRKTEASNQWNYYQAKSNKQNLAEFALALAPAERREFYANEIKRYNADKEEIRVAAEKLETEVKHYDKLSAEADEKSAEAYHPHHRLALAMTLIQIAISLASITVLTRKTWLFWSAGLTAFGGCALWAIGRGPQLLATLLH